MMKSKDNNFIKHNGIWVPRYPIRKRIWRWIKTGLEDKTSWDWLSLLLVPAFLTLGVSFLGYQNDQRQKEINKDQSRQKILEKYLDEISFLMLEKIDHDKKLRKVKRDIAETRTFIAAGELDGKRKGLLIVFLKKSEFIRANITKGDKKINKETPFINLTGIDLSGIQFALGANLDGINLSGSNLRHANLKGVFIGGSDLSNADLQYANLDAAKGLNSSILAGALFCRTRMPDKKINNQDC